MFSFQFICTIKIYNSMHWKKYLGEYKASSVYLWGYRDFYRFMRALYNFHYSHVLLLLSEITTMILKIRKKNTNQKKKALTLVLKNNWHQRSYDVILEKQDVLNRFAHQWLNLGKGCLFVSYCLWGAMPLHVIKIYFFHGSEKGIAH